jgi:hypothetical protein
MKKWKGGKITKYTCLLFFAFQFLSFKSTVNIPKIELNIYNDTTYASWEKFDVNDSFIISSTVTSAKYSVVEFGTQVTLIKEDGSKLIAADKIQKNNNLNKKFITGFYLQSSGYITIGYNIKVMNMKYPGRYISLWKSLKIMK